MDDLGCNIAVVILHIASHDIKCSMLNICKSFSNSFGFLILMSGSQCDATAKKCDAKAHDAALIAMVPSLLSCACCLEITTYEDFTNGLIPNLKWMRDTSLYCADISEIQMHPCAARYQNAANASAVWQNVGRELHWQEPVWKIVVHRQSFFRTLFEYPFRIILFARRSARRASSCAKEKMLRLRAQWAPLLRWLWSWRLDMTMHGPIVLVVEANVEDTWHGQRQTTNII